MKLVIITAIKEFDTEIKKQLKHAKVNTFTFKEVSGYRNSTEDALETNWFSSEINITESIVFYAFVKKENIDALFESINEFKTKQKHFQIFI